MTQADLPEVQKLSEQLGYLSPQDQFVNRFALIHNQAEHALFVLEDEGVKGWIHLEKTLNLISPINVQVKALVVEENERGQGFGKLLLDHGIKWAREEKVSTIYLSANITRDRAHAFYLKNGFTKVKSSYFFEMNI